MVAMEASLYQSCGKQKQIYSVFAPHFAVAGLSCYSSSNGSEFEGDEFFLAEHDNADGVV